MSDQAETHVVPPLTMRITGPIRLKLWTPTGPIDALIIPEAQPHLLPPGFDFTPMCATVPPPPPPSKPIGRGN